MRGARGSARVGARRVTGRGDIRDDRVYLVVLVRAVASPTFGEIEGYGAFAIDRAATRVLDLYAVQLNAIVKHEVIATVARRPAGDPAQFGCALQCAQQRQLAFQRGR